MGRSLSACPKGHKSDSAAQFCSTCFTPQTVIAGDYKPISDYAVGDSCLSQNGFGHVKRTFPRHYEGSLLSIMTRGTLPLTVTPEHPFLVISRTFHGGGGRRHREYGLPYWKKASELAPIRSVKTGDYLLIPRHTDSWDPKDEVDLRAFTTDQGSAVARGRGNLLTFPLNVETAWLLGLYVAEGCSPNKKGELMFSLSKTEKELAGKVEAIGQKLGYKPSSHKRRTALVTIISSRILSRAFSIWCGKYAYGKQVPNFILYNPDHKLVRAFLDGYWAGDGYFLEQRKGRPKSNSGAYIATTVSKRLALQLQLLLARLGCRVRITVHKRTPECRIEGRLVKQRVSYQISYEAKSSKRCQIVVRDDYLLMPVRTITQSEYKGPVYNLETSTGSYMANNVLVHNCGIPMDQGDEKRLPMMVRAKSTSQHKLEWLANHLSHGHMGEAFEEVMDFASEVVNGKASPEQVREMQTTLAKLAKRTWEIVLRENADLQYAVRKAAKELGEEGGDSEEKP